ncbi:hypothetical protein BJF92_07505 [Rhizobium rhizosphaerae]|uniref:WsaF C-terminal domain-containing protein n=1 Tax=Xaviernesmea rhizosphaerae TaxID=1672749 RepID=A0A1Q9AD46_9HYPH|nr:DUF6212 domain-containing protein [Xaviernesmea rhizosphaerae]OLP52817.1 hypothetical protein BJF92_07505 [Xaviernesmea rhizosphaerae]
MAKIVVISPAPIKGSGGVRTILNYAHALMRNGHEVTVSFLADGKPIGTNVSQLVEAYFGISGLHCGQFPFGLHNADLAVATRWDTPPMIRRHFGGKMVHLIQDIEGWFNPVGDAFLYAENNFLFNSSFITLGHWLAKRQQKQYGVNSYTMDFCYDDEVYSLSQPYAERPKRVCFIYQPEKPRRCAQLGLEALGIFKSFHPDYEIVLYGSDAPAYLWYPTVNLGIVSPKELNDLYNASRAGLCISASNPSRIPFEMMGCGLPVVDIYRANNLHDYKSNQLLLAHQTPESIAHALSSLVVDEQLGARLSRLGHESVSGLSLQHEMQQFAAFVEKVANGEQPQPRTDMAPRYRSAPVIAPAYEVDRVRAFCEDQTREFQSEKATISQASTSVEPSAALFATAKLTSTKPAGFIWDMVTLEVDGSLQLNSHQATATTAVLPHALPAGTLSAIAVVRLAHPKASPTEFAMAAVPAIDDEDIIRRPDEQIWSSPMGSGWTEVTPGADVLLQLQLPEPSAVPLDLHIAVRLPEGSPQDFGWCRWVNIIHLQAHQ